MSKTTKEEVRERMVELSRSGHKDKVQQALQKYGAGKFNNVAPKDYDALLVDLGEEKKMVGGSVVAASSWEKKDYTADDVKDLIKTFTWNGKKPEIEALRQRYPSGDPAEWSQFQRNSFVDAAKKIGADYTEYYGDLKSHIENYYDFIFRKFGLRRLVVDSLDILLDPCSSVGHFPGKAEESYFPLPRMVFRGDSSSFSAYAIDPTKARNSKGDFTHMVSRWSRVVPFNLKIVGLADAVGLAGVDSFTLYVTRLPIDAASIVEVISPPDTAYPFAIGLNTAAGLRALKDELENWSFGGSIIVCEDDEPTKHDWNAEAIASEIRKLGIAASVKDFRGGYSTISERLVKDRAGLEADLVFRLNHKERRELFSEPVMWRRMPSFTFRQENYFVGGGD